MKYRVIEVTTDHRDRAVFRCTRVDAQGKVIDPTKVVEVRLLWRRVQSLRKAGILALIKERLQRHQGYKASGIKQAIEGEDIGL